MHVYVDMDGVLVDFFTAIERLQNVEHYSQADVDEVLLKISGTDFFSKLPKLPNADFLIEAIVQIFGEYSILSSPLPSDYANIILHKQKWIDDHLQIPPRQAIFTSDKHKYAAGNILIDDYRVNIDTWIQHGGIGIKYKALSKNYTVHDVVQQLQSINTIIY